MKYIYITFHYLADVFTQRDAQLKRGGVGQFLEQSGLKALLKGPKVKSLQIFRSQDTVQKKT